MDFAKKLGIKLFMKNGWLRYREIECTLASGRKFRYQMQDYPIRIDAPEWELDELACKMIRDKYRYCQWDRQHPRTNQEVEIYDAIKAFMLKQVALARQVLDQEKEQSSPRKPVTDS